MSTERSQTKLHFTPFTPSWEPNNDHGQEQDQVEETEPDYRFTLANERTFLAWIRTALGLLAGGVAVHQLLAPLGMSGARTALALGCLVLSIVLALGAYSHWRSVQRAMRRHGRLPGNTLVPVLAVGAGFIALLAGAVVLLVMTTLTTRSRGLQYERTALSWRRTALSAVAVAALFLHQAAERGWGVATVPALFASCMMLVMASECYRRGRGLHKGHVAVGRHAAAMTSAAVVAGGLSAVAVELWY